ncbi:MAG TPA: hypothetical protein VD999_01760 [Vitreimonas sp.]|nr:hypothetical protein [Vitreimonas sp.]
MDAVVVINSPKTPAGDNLLTQISLFGVEVVEGDLGKSGELFLEFVRGGAFALLFWWKDLEYQPPTFEQYLAEILKVALPEKKVVIVFEYQPYFNLPQEFANQWQIILREDADTDDIWGILIGATQIPKRLNK